jgi:hypothetical protein
MRMMRIIVGMLRIIVGPPSGQALHHRRNDEHAGVMGQPSSIAFRNGRRSPPREGGPNPALTLPGA